AASLRRRGLRPEDCAVFQCRGCRAVLADSLHLARCSRVSLLSSGVTGDVAWEDALLVGLEGALLGCAYNALYCRLCGSMVGFILYSAFSNLAHLRGLFCFFKEKKLVMVHMRLELLIKKTEELKQKNMAQNYGSASDAVALMPGYAIVKTKNNRPF
uniref:Protein yippee-like n=1 Tax=Anas platyrhynchos platyrhynchos TaxID=8840 RepID=U3J1K8_ANAPP